MLVISTNHKCLKPSTRDCQCFFQGSIDDRGKFQHLPYGMFNILRIARKKTCLAGHEIKKKSPVILVTLYEFIGFYWYWMESTSTKVRGSSSIFWPILHPLSFRTKIYTFHLQALLPIDGQNLSAALRESKTKLGPWTV